MLPFHQLAGEWHGRYGRAPLWPNAGYFERLKERFRPD